MRSSAPRSTTTTGWLRDAATLTGAVLRHWNGRPGSLVVSLLFPTATAIRDLLGNPDWNTDGWAAEPSILIALIWPAVLTAIFLPLALASYRRLDR